MSNAELASSYAALILADDAVEISAEKLQALIKAAGVEVEPIWTSIFAKVRRRRLPLSIISARLQDSDGAGGRTGAVNTDADWNI
ncbi:hypothetical protein E4U42_006434 [Claviceps africana]|uniref:Large ribosomal subunit protein P1 n=1 Tax=Claviceps africana TaxID=83212 RepID=A0A8K0J8C9_9HYPO|nr:hypothetical protein E4U42_006434 [Claviceps africana]